NRDDVPRRGGVNRCLDRRIRGVADVGVEDDTFLKLLQEQPMRRRFRGAAEGGGAAGEQGPDARHDVIPLMGLSKQAKERSGDARSRSFARGDTVNAATLV